MTGLHLLKTTALIIAYFTQTQIFAQQSLLANAGIDQVICSTVEDGVDGNILGGLPSATGGVPPYTYSWSFTIEKPWDPNSFFYASDFLNDTTLSNPSIIWMALANSKDFPLFTLTVTDSIGNTSTDSVKLWMSYFNMILPQYEYTITQGDSFYMDRGPDVHGGTGSLSYLWRPNHGLIDSTNETFWAAPDTSIEYYVIGTDSMGCAQKGGKTLVLVTVWPLSVKDGKPNTNIKIYPNPVSGILQIDFSDGQGLHVPKFTLMDMLGKVVLTTTLHSNQNQIDVSHLARGAYSFRVGDSTGKIILK